MASKITIANTKNSVTITPQSNTTINTSTTNTPITVTQGTTSVVTVNTHGPQGIQGISSIAGGDISIRNITASGDISASGTIIADSLNITNGTIFGDNNGTDLVKISGSIEVTGSNGIKVTTNANSSTSTVQLLSDGGGGIVKGGKRLTLRSHGGYDVQIKSTSNQTLFQNNGSTTYAEIGDSTVGGVFFDTNVTASGNISASGALTASNLSGTNTGDQNISNLAITGSNVLFNSITASGNISASGDISANTASFFNIILDHKGATEPTLTFESDGGPDFTFGFNGDNTLQLSGETGATGQVFELASEVETFRMKSGGTALIQKGSGAGTGSKPDGGLFIESQNTDSSNGKAAQFTALSTGGILKNTAYGGTGKHGTFKFINGGNLSNGVDATEHIVAEFGPTSSAHFTFHVPITASGNISASGDITTSNIQVANNIELSQQSKIFVGTNTTEILANGDDYWIVKANGIRVADFKNSGLVVNEGGVAQADFRVESDTNSHLLFTDAGANKVAIGTDTVSDSLLTIEGDISGSGTGSFEHLKLNYDNMPTSDPGVKGTIYRSSSAGISNLLFISPGS